MNRDFKKILCENNLLLNTYYMHANKITDSILFDVLTKVKNKDYPIEKAALALRLYSELGENWKFHNFENDSDIPVFDNVEEFIEYKKNFRDNLKTRIIISDTLN